MSNPCSIYFDKINSSNATDILSKYYKSQQLQPLWNKEQSFNQENYVMSSLMVQATYLCCGGAKGSQACSSNEINELISKFGITNINQVISQYNILFNNRSAPKSLFATIGLIEGTDLGVISWRGTSDTDDWIADASPGLKEAPFETCSNVLLDQCDLKIPIGFDKNSGMHSAMLQIYNNSFVSNNDKIYTLYGAITNLYPSNTKWIVSGHSLGAALAELCTADLSSKGVKINSSYLFADPSPGNQYYQNSYNNMSDNFSGEKLSNITYNIKNNNDIVPDSLSYWKWGRNLVGTVKSWDGVKSHKLKTFGIAHNIAISYLDDAVKNFFSGKSGILTSSIESFTQQSEKKPKKSLGGIPSYVYILIIIFLFLMSLILCLLWFKECKGKNTISNSY